MAEKCMYVKMIKPWSVYQIGDVVRFGWNKGQARIDKGEGIRVPKQSAVNDPMPEPKKIEPPKVETTDAVLSIELERAVVTPEVIPKDEIIPKRRGKKSRKKGGG